MALRIDDLPASELRLALAASPDDLSEEEAFAIRDFIERIGGREDAMLAVELLDEIERGQPN